MYRYNTKMGDSLQDYFSNLLGGVGNCSTEIVADNARTPPSRHSSVTSSDKVQLDWLTDCCAMDTTTVSCVPGGFDSPFLFSRWESEPYQASATKRDSVIQRPIRRTRSNSENQGDESDFKATFMPSEEAFDQQDGQPQMAKQLPARAL